MKVGQGHALLTLGGPMLSYSSACVLALSTKSTLARIDALGVLDAGLVALSPGSLLVEFLPQDTSDVLGLRSRLLAVGSPREIDAHEASSSPGLQRIRRPTSILIPAMVNAHAHLDLTHIGPQPHDPERGFVPWIDLIRAGRRREAEGITQSVTQGIALSLKGGVVAIGDIAGCPGGPPSIVPWRVILKSPLLGISFLEFFGLGQSAERSLAALREALDAAGEEGGPRQLGLSPHAPNTVSRWLYERALALAHTRDPVLPIATHLAETIEERRFVAEGLGPQRELLERLGIWNDSMLDEIGRGLHPVEHLRGFLEQSARTDSPPHSPAPLILAHVNDASDEAIELLAGVGASVAYCPRASSYFANDRHFGPHRYQDMLRAGINVCLGTDSVVNLPRRDIDRSGISVFDEMKLLWARDGTDPRVLLAMATIHGARALGLPTSAFTFTAASMLAGLVSVDGCGHAPGPEPTNLGTLMMRSTSQELLFGGKNSVLAGK